MFEIGGIYDFTMIEGYDDQGKPHNDLLWRYRIVSIDGPLLDIDPEMAKHGQRRQVINTHSPFFIKAERQPDKLPTLNLQDPRG